MIAIPVSNKGLPVFKQSRIVKLDLPPEQAQKALQMGWSLINMVPGDKTTVAVKIVIRDNSSGRIGSVMFPLARPAGS